MSDILAAFFLIAGSFFMFLAGLGTLRFPDLYSRMHDRSHNMRTMGDMPRSKWNRSSSK